MATGQAVKLFFGVGLIFIIVGAVWLIMNDPVNEIWEDYGLGEAPFVIMYMGWNVSGTVFLFLIGIAFLIAGGYISRRSVTI